MKWSWLVVSTVAVFCECGNDPLFFIKGREFFDWHEKYVVFKTE
jgi:hypothetical protein